MSVAVPWFVRRDLDGFFGLFIDNLVQLLLITGLCAGLCGMQGDASSLLTDRILPGAAISILFGNLFYAWQCRRLAMRTGRDDVTALPYGINTPSLLVFVFFVMVPTFARETAAGRTTVEAATRAWQMGLVACFGSGLIEFFGSFVAGTLRRITPRAALLSTLAGIAIGFISMTFTLQIIHKPVVAMLPLAIVLMTYFAGCKFPLHLPGGFFSVLVGTAIAWLLTGLARLWPEAPAWLIESQMNPAALAASFNWSGIRWPIWCGPELWSVLQSPDEWLGFLSVIVPMGLFNVIGSLQNIESAAAGGDEYGTLSSLAINGLGTMLAAALGSCFPTTIYIGHPGWKQLGARGGYSTLNGLAITAICLSGTIGLIQQLIPLEAGVGIVLWIGIIITAQAFAATKAEHAPAVAIGLFPAIAAWGQTVTQGAFLVAGGKTMQDVLQSNLGAEVNGFLLNGLLLMERGYIFTCIVLSAMTACLINRQFRIAGCWALLGAVCALSGLTHAYQLQGNAVDYLFALQMPPATSFNVRGYGIGLGYTMIAALLFVYPLLSPGAKTDESPVEQPVGFSS